jgi:hypothetical protein
VPAGGTVVGTGAAGVATSAEVLSILSSDCGLAEAVLTLR